MHFRYYNSLVEDGYCKDVKMLKANFYNRDPVLTVKYGVLLLWATDTLNADPQDFCALAPSNYIKLLQLKSLSGFYLQSWEIWLVDWLFHVDVVVLEQHLLH